MASGSAVCSCRAGYVPGDDEKTCDGEVSRSVGTTPVILPSLRVDVNECLVDNGGCTEICTNIKGSHECECDTGYTLDLTDFRSCTGKI